VNSFLIGFIAAALISLTILIPSAYAHATPNVVINEFSIEPEQTIELLNISAEMIDVSGWHIDDNGGTTYITIPEDSRISPHSCIVIQKNFNLNKSSPDTVRLFDNTAPPTDSSSILIDFYDYEKSPGNGNSLQRNPDGTDIWEAAPSSFGFFNDTNEPCHNLPTGIPTPSIPPTLPPSPFKNIFISEAMVAPDSGQSEWVELFNDNDFQVDLSGWYIDDIKDAGASPKMISLSIDPYQYGVFELSTALFNNSGDSVRLLNSNGDEQDTFSYAYSEKGRSWGWRTLKSTLFCTQYPSKGVQNSDCSPEETDSTTEEPFFSTNTKSAISPSDKPTPAIVTLTPYRIRHYTSYGIPIKTTLPPNNPIPGHDPDVLGSTSIDELPYQNTVDLSPLAIGYSLLSIGSLISKMIYSN